MTHAQDTTQAQAALLRNDSGIATPVTDCGCEAASIIDPLSATTEGLVPHEKLREAATPKASLIALDRPPAQLAKGYTHPTMIIPLALAEQIARPPAGGKTYDAIDQLRAMLDVPAVEPGSEEFCHLSTIEWRGYHLGWAAAMQQRANDTGKPAAQQEAEQPSEFRASSLREAMESTAASGKRCALIIGDTLLQVSYHGLKWYHDLITPNQSSLPLTVEEFDQIAEKSLTRQPETGPNQDSNATREGQ